MIVLHTMEFEGWTVMIQSTDLVLSGSRAAPPPAAGS